MKWYKEKRIKESKTKNGSEQYWTVSKATKFKTYLQGKIKMNTKQTIKKKGKNP